MAKNSIDACHAPLSQLIELLTDKVFGKVNQLSTDP
jgi:hypothetical protein